MSLVPNRKGQPLLVDWRVATAPSRRRFHVSNPSTQFIARAGLKAGGLPNPGHTPGLDEAMQGHAAGPARRPCRRCMRT